MARALDVLGYGAVLGIATAGLLSGAAQAAPYRPPRTPWGAPSLEGLWNNYAFTYLERPEHVTPLVLDGPGAAAAEAAILKGIAADDALGQRQSEWWVEARLARIDGKPRTSWIVSPSNGHLPYSAEGLRRVKAEIARGRGSDGPELRTASDRCLAVGWSGMSAPILNPPQNANYRIIQTRDEVVIAAEMNHDVRHIRLNAKGHPPGLHLWMGDSIGHWEGQTLVVDTTGFHPGESFRRPIVYISPDARVTERFTRQSATEVRYAFTVDDPQVFTQPWSGEEPFLASKDATYEVACHEGNYSMAGILAGARRDEAEAKRKAAGTAGR